MKMNRQSAEAMAQLLIAKVRYVAEKEELLRQTSLDPVLAKPRHVDLLITRVDNSLWLGEQFGQDLSALMPLLTVRSLSDNAVLSALQNDIELLDFARQSIVVVLTHSRRTFPSVQVAEEACDLLVRRDVTREFFIITGEPDSLHSLLGAQMLSLRRPGGDFSRRLFTTGTGRRRAEPATASVAAMHQTLTELLFSLYREVKRDVADPVQRPLGMRPTWEELLRLQDIEDQHFLQEAGGVIGTGANGRKRATNHPGSLPMSADTGLNMCSRARSLGRSTPFAS